MQKQEESSQLKKDPAVIYVRNELLVKGCGSAVAHGMSKSGSQQHICKIVLQLMGFNVRASLLFLSHSLPTRLHQTKALSLEITELWGGLSRKGL